jgi:hypothetical protein
MLKTIGVLFAILVFPWFTAWMCRDNIVEFSLERNRPDVLEKLLQFHIIEPGYAGQGPSVVNLVFLKSVEPIRFIEVILNNGLPIDDTEVLSNAVSFRDYEVLKLLAEKKYPIFPIRNNHILFSEIPDEMVQHDAEIAEIIETAFNNHEKLCSTDTISVRDRSKIRDRLPITNAKLEDLCGTLK